jgi:hypothetical protein
MAAAAPIIAGSWASAAGLVGAGAAGLGAVLGALGGLFPVIPVRPPGLPGGAPQPPAGQTAVSNAHRIANRVRSISTRLRPLAVEVLRDMAKETLEKAVTTPFAIGALTDALGYWLVSDLRARSLFHRDLHVPTRETFTYTIDAVADTIAALLLVDVVSGRDVGSDLAESIIDGFAESVVGDSIKAYLDTISGVEAVDDDEIRDIVGEGAAQTPEELAYLGARSGLDTYSAMVELYTGLLQGDNPYWSRVVRELDEIFKRWERGLAPVYIIGNILEKLGGDVADGIYWYLGALDRIENRLQSLAKDVYDMYVLYRRGIVSGDRFVSFYNSALLEVDAVEDAVEALDDSFIEEYADMLYTSFVDLANSAPYYVLHSLIQDLMIDAGHRIREHVEAAAGAYMKLRDLRTVSVTAQ